MPSEVTRKYQQSRISIERPPGVASPLSLCITLHLRVCRSLLLCHISFLPPYKGRRGRAGLFPLVAAMFFAKHRRNEHYFSEIVDFYLENPQKNRLFLGKNRLFGRACPKRWRYRDSVASCPLQRGILDVFLIHEFVRRYKGDAPNIGRKRGIQLRLHVVQFIGTAE